MKSTTWTLLLAAALSVLLAGCGISLAGDVTPPPNYEAPRFDEQITVIEGAAPEQVPDVLNGALIYQDKCVDCHGDTGLGDGPASNELPVQVSAIGSSEMAAANSPLAWYSMVTNGNLNNFMPPFSSLSDQERWDVVAYVYSLSASVSLAEEGQALYDAQCAACHGADLSGTADAPVDLTDTALMVQRSDLELATTIFNGQGEMPAFDDLSQMELAALVTFVRSASFPLGDRTAIQVALPDVADDGPAATRPDVSGADVSDDDVSDDAAGDEGAEGGDDAAVAPTAEAGDAVDAPEASDTADDDTLIDTDALSVTVSGVVSNGSGGDVPAGLTVTLQGFDHMDPAIELTTEVGADGRYSFEDVAWGDQRIYFVTVDYAAMNFASDLGIADALTTTFDLPVTIYETTTSTADLTVDRLHIFFEFSTPDAVQVVMLYLVSNTGNTAVVPAGDDQPVLTYTLPEGATNLVFEDQSSVGRFVATADGFGDMRSILPNTSSYQLLYAYHLPYTRSLDLEQLINLDVSGVGIFVSADTVQLSGTDVEPTGAEPFGGVSYELYEMGGVQAGDSLHIELRGRHPAGSTGGGLALGDTSTLVIGGVALGAAVAGVWYFVVRRDDTAYWDDELDWDDADALLDAVVALDEDFEAGAVSDGDYRRERAILKARLSALMADA